MSNNKKRIFVTGLCLQGNKGGPALALSIYNALKNKMNISEFTLSVPGGANFKFEQEMAQKYSFNVVERISIKSLLQGIMKKEVRKKIKLWFEAAKKSDVIIDMTAISYVGPPTGTYKNMLHGRFFNFVISKLMAKKFLAWTQSYGPFSTPLVSLLAKWDLSNQKIIFCRGEGCASAVRTILPNKEVKAYPDIAVKLPYSIEAGIEILANQLREQGNSKKIVTISPSSVLYNSVTGEGLANVHVKQTVELCDWLIERGYTPVLLPHTLRRVNSTFGNCDFEVCRLVHSTISAQEKAILLTEDYTPVELKSVISNACLHVGARYHSVVAALSTAVPCISLSWHPKYEDILSFYQTPENLYSPSISDSSELINLVENVLTNLDAYKEKLNSSSNNVLDLLDENIRFFVNLIEGKK